LRISPLAVALAPSVECIVIDEMELVGAFDIRLIWAEPLPRADPSSSSIA
jgi:hypothetical protein